MTVADQRSGDFRSFYGVIDLKFRGIKGTEEYVIFLPSPWACNLIFHLAPTLHFVTDELNLKYLQGLFA